MSLYVSVWRRNVEERGQGSRNAGTIYVTSRGDARAGAQNRRLLMPHTAFRSDAPRTLRIVRPIMIGYSTLLSGPAETNKAC